MNDDMTKRFVQDSINRSFNGLLKHKISVILALILFILDHKPAFIENKV